MSVITNMSLPIEVTSLARSAPEIWLQWILLGIIGVSLNTKKLKECGSVQNSQMFKKNEHLKIMKTLEQKPPVNSRSSNLTVYERESRDSEVGINC